MDTHDLRRGLHFEIRNRNFTRIPRTWHARSPQRVALRNQKSQLYLHSAHSTRTISAEGCTLKSKNAISLAFRALDTHDLRRGFTFRNHTAEVLRLPRNHDPRSYEMLHWPRKSILKLKFQKCNPSQELSPLTSKYRIHGADALRLPRKTQSFEWRTPANVLAMSTKYCACHDFHNVSDSLRLPRKLTFLTSISDGFLAPPCKMNFMSENMHEHPVKRRLRNCDFRGPQFVRACAVEINIESQNGIPAQTKPPAHRAYPDRTPAFTLTVRTPSV